MPTQKKVFTVQNLSQKLKDAKTLVLADYRGLSVGQMTDLRGKVKQVGGEVEVVKNRLLKIAAKEAKVEIDDQILTGPTAVIWAWEDQIQPLKALDTFAKENDLPKAKFGLFEGKIISIEKIKELANLPSQDELRAKLVGALHSPTYGLVNSLNWNLKKLVYILKTKSEGGD